MMDDEGVKSGIIKSEIRNFKWDITTTTAFQT
jgi:hypothetical protein